MGNQKQTIILFDCAAAVIPWACPCYQAQKSARQKFYGEYPQGGACVSPARKRRIDFQAAGILEDMEKKILVYGILGWCAEILWTGLCSFLAGDGALTAKTYLWMFPIYPQAAPWHSWLLLSYLSAHRPLSAWNAAAYAG